MVFVLLAAVASTKSTGGYMMVPLAMMFHGKAIGKNIAIRAVLVLAAIGGVIYLFENADFLGNKISDQYGQVQAQQAQWQLTRLGSMIYDFHLIQERPLFGWGPDPENRNGTADQTVTSKEGNGLSNFTASFGFIGLALFMVSAWAAFRNLFGGKWILATLALIVTVGLLNEECFLSFPVFMTLMFLRRPVQRLARSSVAVKSASNDFRSVNSLQPAEASGSLNPAA